MVVENARDLRRTEDRDMRNDFAGGAAGTIEQPWAPDRPIRRDYLVYGSPQILQPDIDEVA